MAFTNADLRLFVRKPVTMPKLCLSKKAIVLVVLLLVNLLYLGYLFVSKHKALHRAVTRGLYVPTESPSKHIFDRQKEIHKNNPIKHSHFMEGVFQKKNSIEHTHFMENFFQNKGIDEFIKIKEVKKSQRASQSNITVNANATKPVYLCISLHAGLANRLYMYASSYGLAKDKGMILVIPHGMETLNASFHVNGTYKTQPNLCEKTQLIDESACCKLSPNILHLPNDRSVRIKGYLQSFRYFEKYRPELKRILMFRDIVLNEAKAKLHKLLSVKYIGETRYSLYNRTLVGIHIRRGDYTLPHSKAFGYRMATKEYIFKAVDYMTRKFSNVTFVACSNDLDWTKSVFRDHKDVIVAPMGRAEVDLALLTLMNHTIITVGTYSFWAAWLNPQNGTVLYYKDFVRKGTLFSKGFAHPNTDTYYSYWIGL